jgi:hypothetical protein
MCELLMMTGAEEWKHIDTRPNGGRSKRRPYERKQETTDLLLARG